MNSDLKESLLKAFRTVASVNSPGSAALCIEQASDYWISNHLRQPWAIVSIDIMLAVNVVRALDATHIGQRSLGILTTNTPLLFQLSSPLFIYTTDRYTENWVHETIMTAAKSSNDARVLNVQRDDKGPILDLGDGL